MSIEAEREMWGAIARQDRPRGLPDRTITNRRPGDCHLCGQTVAAGTGLAELRGRTWTVRHRPQSWHGSPVSGRWIDGCPS